MTAPDRAARFRDLHVPGRPLLMPNPWDVGSARLLAAQGFAALATTSGGYALRSGRADGAVGRDETLAHAAAIVAAVDVPVSADFEDGFGDDPAGVAENVRRAAATGLAGCSIEDYRDGVGILDLAEATERVVAAAEAAHATPGLVLTARAENFFRGRPDLDDTITRLQAYQDAGADVLYAPGIVELDDVRRVVTAVDRPVNVLARPGMASVAALADAGVARLSVGSALHLAALGALARAGRELLDDGTYGFLDLATEGRTHVPSIVG